MKRILAHFSFLLLTLSLFLTGCEEEKGENPLVNGIDGPSVHLLNGQVIFSIAIHDISIDIGMVIPVPRYPHSSFQIGPDFQSNGVLLSLSLSIEDFIENQGLGLNPQALPGGRPIPGVAAGALPAMAVQIPVLQNAVLYLGPQVIGLFVPFEELDLLGMIITFKFFDTDKRRVGFLSLVGSDVRGQHAGILALMHPDLLGVRGESARKDFIQRRSQ